MSFQFIATYQERFSVRLMCRLLGVSASGYYAWRGRKPAKRRQEDAELSQMIITIHDESHETYGYRRVYQTLLALKQKVSRRRVARLMRQLQRQGRQYRRYQATTKPGKRLPNVPDLLARSFTVDQPNKVWVSDITYIRTGQGWLYLAAVLDLFARRIVGWAMDASLTQELTLRALRMALQMRQPLPGLIHHSDHGSQYTSLEYQLLLQAHQAQPSMGRVGSCFDNAVMESFFGTLKSEWLSFQRFATRQQAITSSFYYIELFYNRKRLHSANGYLSPLAFEEAAANSMQSDLLVCPLI